MSYRPKLFQPAPTGHAGGRPYVFADPVLVAIDVALAAGRPLLVTGNPGCGKTTLARAVAAGQNWRYLERTITSRTRLEDLEADLDTLRRLSDAQLGRAAGLPPDWTYLRPGVFWWAFDREGARRRGASAAEFAALTADGHPVPADAVDPSRGNTATADVVVLLDEIDKADPDLPNDLLEPLDRRSFALQSIQRPAVRAPDGVKIMLIMTTNGERELPAAFLRRCVVLELPDAQSQGDAPLRSGEISLEAIAEAHFGRSDARQNLYRRVAKVVTTLRQEAARTGVRPPSTAEYIDTLRALIAVPELERDDVWSQVQRILLMKAPAAAVRP